MPRADPLTLGYVLLSTDGQSAWTRLGLRPLRGLRIADLATWLQLSAARKAAAALEQVSGVNLRPERARVAKG
jgi:hypothetical protein